MPIAGVSPNYGVGKDIPAMGPFRNYQPKLQGPGSGKLKAVIIAGQFAYNQLKNRPSLGGALTGIAIGTGVTLDYGENASSNQLDKALRAIRQYSSRKRSSKGRRPGKRSHTKCCRCCH